MYRVRELAYLIILALAGMSSIKAQVLYGSIAGTVTDTTQASIPGATVQVVNVDVNQSRQTVSNNSGEFSFPALPAGTYRLTVTKAGFQSFSETDITVATDQVVRVNAMLPVGTVDQRTEVVADAARLQTETAQVQATVDQAVIESIPVPVNRNFENLLVTVPGVMPLQNENSNAANPSRGMGTSVNGTQLVENNVRVDGASAQNPWLPYVIAYVPSLDAIEQVSVVTNTFDATQGLVGGAAVNVHMKSGTDQLHGSAYELNQDDAVGSAKPFFSPGQLPKFINNDYGATVGGPVRKDKLFYFVAFEGNDFSEFSSTLTTVPVAQNRTGNFSNTTSLIYDPNTGSANGTGRTPFPGNIIPSTRLDPIVQQIEQYIPLPNESGTSNNYYGTGDFNLQRYTTDAKIDYRATDKLIFSARTGWLRYNQLNPPAFLDDMGPPVYSSSRAGNAYGNVYNSTISVTYIATPNLVLDGFFSPTLMSTNSVPLDVTQNVGTQLGIPGTNGPISAYGGWPWFNVSDYGTIGNSGSSTGGQIHYNDSYSQSAGHATWIKGKHNLKFGVEFDRTTLNHVDDSASLAGEFSFAGGPTALAPSGSTNQYNDYADFLLGLPTTVAKDLLPFNGGAITEHWWTYSLFIQDQWHIRPKLTMSFGTGWNYFPIASRSGRGVERYNFNTNQLEICGIAGNSSSCGVQAGKKDFSPNLGFAYQATPTLVIRAGGGLSFDPTPLAYNRDLFANYPGDLTLTLNQTSTYLAASTLEAGIPPIPVPNISSGSLALPPQFGITTLPQNPRRDYVLSWNFTLQKELKWGFVGQTGYVATRGVDIPYEMNQNISQTLGGGSGADPYFQLYGNSNSLAIITNDNHTHYDSLQNRLTRSFSKGFLFQAAYTFSKNTGYCCNTMADSTPAIQLPAYFQLNRSLEAFDRTHLLVLTGIAQLPFGKGKAWLTHGVPAAVAGGWSVNGLMTWSSGQPFSVSASGTSLNTPGTTQRANQILPNVQILGGIGATESYFNPLAFAQPTCVCFGTAGFYTLRAPNDFNTDLSIFRTFPIRENWNLKFTAEAFNVTNTPHFAAPNGAVNDLVLGPGGTIQSLGGYTTITSTLGTGREGIDQRVLRLGLKLTF